MSGLRIKENGDNEVYLDVHGREIPSVINEKTGEVALPLVEIKQIAGVPLFKKSQYAKLSTIDEKDFSDDFTLAMLEMAQQYMLNNKVAFTGEKIATIINDIKKVLSEAGTKKPESSKNNFLGNRMIEETSDHDIQIQVNVTQTSAAQPTSLASSRKSFHKPTTQFSPKSSQAFENKQPTKPVTTKLQRKNFTNFSEESETSDEPSPKQNRRKFERKVQKREESQWQKSSEPQHQKSFVSEGKKKEESQKPKLRLPKTNPLEKVNLDKNLKKEHDVTVTCIHKRNCIWVRDKENQEIFDTIHRLVNEEAKFQKIASRPYQHEKVYMAYAEGAWFRCKVLRFNPLKVFFLDYGNVVEVDEIKEVSEELAKVPCMAVRLTFKEEEYDPCLEDEIKIKIIIQNEDTTYFVKVLKQTKMNDTAGPSAVTQAKVAKEPKNYFKKPPPMVTLANGLKVIVIHVDESGIFYLRTKECFRKLQQIEEHIKTYAETAPPLKEVTVAQLVLAPDDFDDVYHRAVVIGVNSRRAEVKFLDFCQKNIVELSLLKNINESLSLEPVSYFRGKHLKGFSNGELSDENRTVIASMIEIKKKFVVELDENGDFDLFDGSMRLSQMLSRGKKLRLQDMKTYKPEIGISSYLCGYYRSSSEFAIVPSAELEQHIDTVLITDIKDTKPYTPIVGEVCFCYYTDQWYRCVVTRQLNDEFEVVLLDFGNIELVKKDDIRKATDEITEVPVLALPSKLINLPNHPKVEDLLTNLVIEGELYKVNVISLNEGKYEVEIPTVYQSIEATPK